MLMKGRLWFLSLWLVSLWPTLGAKEIDDAPINIDSRLEVFVDDFLMERMPGVDLRLHSPQPAGTALTFSVVLSEKNSAESKELTELETSSGVRFGLLGKRAVFPAPTVFVFATTWRDTLNAVYRELDVVRTLSEQGFLCVSLDLPCHGADRRPGEAGGLQCWRARLEKGDDTIHSFVSRVSAVLDYLIQEGYSDAGTIAACGTSRGGFMALHFAAADSRVKCVAAFAPVTDLRVLNEFAGLEDHREISSLALVNRAARLANRALWVCIGNSDERVGTDHAIAFTRRVTEAALSEGLLPDVELHVFPSTGHTLHPTAHEEASAWILARLKTRK